MRPEPDIPTPPPETEAKAQPRRLSLDPPLIPPTGRTINLTNEKIDELLGQA